MPEFFLDFCSEEMPARMQGHALFTLSDICVQCLSFINFRPDKVLFGPRHIAICGQVDDSNEGGGLEEIKGPREGAPDIALDGFAKKHGMRRSDMFLRNGSYFLSKPVVQMSDRETIETQLPLALSKFSWPKSMRWGQSGDFSWVRPLRRIVCLLDGEVIPITLGPVEANDETEGHRFMAPGTFKVSSAADWKDKLREHYVIVDQDERKQLILDGLSGEAFALGLTVVDDEILLNEVTGLVEWPVPLIGKIDLQFMNLPPAVRELSMKVNQKYFAMRDAEGEPAPFFAFVANMEAPDGGAAIIAGNERVLRARLADAQHFWDIDLKTPLDALLPKLGKITFHSKIGTQLQRSERIGKLAGQIASGIGADADQAVWAGRLCKADLVTGMVGEFPELQGIMGGYYASRNARGWDGAVVGPAIKTHYQPRGPNDAVPTDMVAVSVSLADKLDTLAEFFRIGETPTGSGDPYALRRAALGVIRIILENNLRLPLKPFLGGDESLFDFIIERLRIKLRNEGKRFDVLDAVLVAGTEDDLVRLMKRVDALDNMLVTDDGKNLLAAYKRAANILKIEDAKDGPHTPYASQDFFKMAEEDRLLQALTKVQDNTEDHIEKSNFAEAMILFAQLRAPVDAFFANVTVNAESPELRLNRLRLLVRFRNTMHQIADFSKIEG